MESALYLGMWLSMLILGAVCSDAQGFSCERSVSATIEAASENRLKINVALGEVVSLNLPEDVELRGEPALGNAALFDVKVVADPLRVLVWPRLPRAAANLDPSQILGERSNLQLFLDSGVTVLIELRIARPGRAVQQVRFSFPEREAESAYVRARVAEENRRLEAEYQEKRAALEREIGQAARQRVADGMLAHAECRSLRERSMRDLVVLRVHGICRIGLDIYVTFSVHNRSRDPFLVGEVEVHGVDAEAEPRDAESTYEGPKFLVFDQRVKGVLSWSVEADEVVPRWTLVVDEGAGAGRSVRIEEVGF